MSLILGVDPGLGGALIVLDTALNHVAGVFDMPTSGDKTKRRVEGSLLADIIQQWGPACAAIELVGPRPHDGPQQAFRFGASYGCVLGVVAALGVPFTLYTPQSWMKPLGLKGGDKETQRQAALALYPTAARWMKRKLDHGRANAILIARHHAIKTGRIAG